MDTKPAPPAPKPSSTVMVVRPLDTADENAGFELFMVRRHSKSRFMPDRYVFPGGRLEENDASPAALARLHGFEPDGETPLFRDLPGEGAHAAAVPLTRAQEAGLYLAAFRELFEEAGLLLALDQTTGQAPDFQQDEAQAARIIAARHEMQAGKLDFITMLEQEKLLLDFNGLIYFSHWITPVSEPYRFDARFFLAQAPLDQLAESDYVETTDGVWITPQSALERLAANDFEMAYPTILHVEWLRQHRSIAAAWAAARLKTVVAAMPNMQEGEHGPTFELGEGVINRW